MVPAPAWLAGPVAGGGSIVVGVQLRRLTAGWLMVPAPAWSAEPVAGGGSIAPASASLSVEWLVVVCLSPVFSCFR
ncbi:hypothetical protein [Flindersiella endophytica]